MFTISEKIQDLLSKQVAHELTNANIYIYISHYFSNFELNNFSKMYLKQSDEEKQHANMIIQYMQDMDCIYQSYPVENKELDIKGILQAVELVYQTELKTTEYLNQISKTCVEDSDFVTHDFISQMLREQREEIASSREIYIKIKNIEANHGFLLVMDNEL